MACKEGSQGLCHAARVLHMQEMIRVRKHERLCIRQPIQEQLLSLDVNGGDLGALGSQNGEDWLGEPML